MLLHISHCEEFLSFRTLVWARRSLAAAFGPSVRTAGAQRSGTRQTFVVTSAPTPASDHTAVISARTLPRGKNTCPPIREGNTVRTVAVNRESVSNNLGRNNLKTTSRNRRLRILLQKPTSRKILLASRLEYNISRSRSHQSRTCFWNTRKKTSNWRNRK